MEPASAAAEPGTKWASQARGGARSRDTAYARPPLLGPLLKRLWHLPRPSALLTSTLSLSGTVTGTRCLLLSLAPANS